MQNVKNTAYAWRQMLFFLSVADDHELPRFVEWSNEYLATQREAFRTRFAPVMAGLEAIAAGGRFDHAGLHAASGGRQFLGWTLGRHWLLPQVSEAATSADMP
jgi:hypothetical protein